MGRNRLSASCRLNGSRPRILLGEIMSTDEHIKPDEYHHPGQLLLRSYRGPGVLRKIAALRIMDAEGLTDVPMAGLIAECRGIQFNTAMRWINEAREAGMETLLQLASEGKTGDRDLQGLLRKRRAKAVLDNSSPVKFGDHNGQVHIQTSPFPGVAQASVKPVESTQPSTIPPAPLLPGQAASDQLAELNDNLKSVGIALAKLLEFMSSREVTP